jgi:tetraacyldisaccharide 4'-kinase
MLANDSVPKRPRIESLWRKKIPWYDWFLWFPLTFPAYVYALAMTLRAGFWRIPGMRSRVRKARVVSVGNLTVGGNGKTPFTLYLARALRKRGLAVGIVSRGYLGTKSGKEPALVSDGHDVLLDPREAGDEAIMMAKSFDGPIAIAPNRIDGVRLLLRHSPLHVVLLDDAFQHLSLKRDVNLLLVNYERGFDNGWTLPAGPMRERLRASRRATAVVLLTSSHGEQCGLSDRQLRRIGRRKTLGGVLRPSALVQSVNGRWHEIPLGPLNSRRVVAVSGLADPSGFHSMLRDLDADFAAVLEYPDHYDYDAADWQEISRVAGDADMVITTEKDLVKLERFPFPRDMLYALRLEVNLGDKEEQLIETVLGGSRQASRLAFRA